MMKTMDGYKKTRIGTIPEEWPICSLRDVAKLINGDRGKNYPAQNEIVDAGVPFVNAGHLSNGRIDFSAMNYISEDTFKRLSSGKFQQNDIIYCLRGTLGKNAFVDRNYSGAIASSLVIFRPNRFIFPKYLFFICNSQIELMQRSQIDTGSAQPNLSAENVSKYLLPVPPLPEQCKIADILSTVDEHISETEDLIQHTKTLKQGMMQRLLTKGIGHTKFKETEIGRIPLEWKIVPITDTAAFINGYPFKPEEWSQAGIPIIRIQNLTDPSKEYNFSEVSLDQSYKVSCGELLLSWSGTIGIYMWRGIDAYLNQHIYKVLPNALSVKDFLKHSLNFVVTRMAEKSHGSTMKHITKREMSTISVPLPPLSEQRQIASILTTIDNQVASHQNKLDALTRLKSGLMQQLLTGRIRVKV